MAKARLFDLPETKGVFQLKGVITGTEKESFYKEIKTKRDKPMRMVNFGVTYIEGSTLYLNMQGMEQENVYFSKKAEKKGEKGDTVKVPWVERFSYNREGYKLIGKNIGVKKKVDADGKTINDKKILTEFDACKELHEGLKDGASVFIKGNLNYSSYEDDNGNKRVSTKLIPNQISLCSDIHFNDEKFNRQNDFNQVIVFMGISKEDDSEKDAGCFLVAAKIITYSTIEDVEFIITDQKLAGMFKKHLKPYNAIKVSGHMVSSIQTEKAEDEWGEIDTIEKVSSPAKREFFITGAKGSSIEKELYTEENIEKAMVSINQAKKAENDFGKNANREDWGDANLDDDDDDPWE